MHKRMAMAVGLALGLLTVWAFTSSEASAQSVLPPTSLPCTLVSTVACSGATGVCNGLVPDAGSATGISAAGVRSYHFFSLPPQGQSITAAGDFRNFHCRASYGRCPEVVGNRQSVTVAPTAATGAVANGIGTDRGGAYESAAFSVPYHDNTSDTINVVPTGITVSPTDGGSLLTYICPAN